jgi:hypothetical protein
MRNKRPGSRDQSSAAYLRSIAICAVAVFLSSLSVAAQDGTDNSAPPPLKLISRSEREQLASKPQVKDHTNLALQLMNARLKAAEKHLTDENFSLLYAELGGFHGIMDNTLDFLIRSGPSDGKVLNSLKKYEIGLRGFVPRLEIIRRELPSNFEPYLKTLIRSLGETREKAIEPFFGNTVISRVRTEP